MSATKATPATESCFRFHRELDLILSDTSDLYRRFDNNEEGVSRSLEFMSPGQERTYQERMQRDWCAARSLVGYLTKVGGWLRVMVMDLDANKDKLRTLDSPVARDIVARCARAEEVAERNAKERDEARAALAKIAALQATEPKDSERMGVNAYNDGYGDGRNYGEWVAAEMAREALRGMP